VHFGVSTFRDGVIAFSRILNDRGVVVAANTSTTSGWEGEVIVDASLNAAGATYEVAFTNKASGRAPGPVVPKPSGSVEIHEVSGAVTDGPARAMGVSLAPMEIQILTRASGAS
jgi:hypothetical protein